MKGMNAATGKPIEGLAHLRQSIADILTTPLGSRLQRRDYGSLVPSLIDAPGNGPTMIRIYAAVATALMRWEPRVRVTRIGLNQLAAGGAAEVEIEGQLADGTAVTTSVPWGAG